MLRGCDVSGWNTLEQNEPFDFTLVKATEGVGWKSDMLEKWVVDICGSREPNPKKRYGFYHYARPDTGNTAAAEANWFLSVIHPHIGYAALALDWEELSLNTDPSWALEFLNIVHTRTGQCPLIYLQASEAKKAIYTAIAAKFPLWLADWGAAASSGVWKYYSIWQTGKTDGVDVDLCKEETWCGIAPKYTGDYIPSLSTGRWKIVSQQGNAIVLSDGNLKIQLEAPNA